MADLCTFIRLDGRRRLAWNIFFFILNVILFTSVHVSHSHPLTHPLNPRKLIILYIYVPVKSCKMLINTKESLRAISVAGETLSEGRISVKAFCKITFRFPRTRRSRIHFEIAGKSFLGHKNDHISRTLRARCTYILRRRKTLLISDSDPSIKTLTSPKCKAKP